MGKSNTNNKSDKTGSYTEFYYHFLRNTLIVSLPILVISALILGLTVSHSSATSSGTDSFTVSISSACTLSSVVDSEHNIETNVGTYVADVGKTTIKTLCNDGNGYSVYAIGYSNNEEGNNKLINSEYPQYSIDTGLNTSGLTSQWAMKLSNIPDDPSPTPPTIESDYNNVYGVIPPYWTKVASRTSGTTDMAQGSSFTTTYAVYASSSQYAGTYQGQVKYLLTHPSTDAKYFFMQDIAQLKDKILLNEGDSTQLIDQRDGKSYWVTRLADGNIWMTQNLDFDISANTTLNSNTTDLNTYNVSGYTDGYSKTGDTIYWEIINTATTIDFEGATVTDWVNSDTLPYSANKTDSTETGHASLGNYYNWTAAIASNNSSSLTQNTLNNIANNPQNSICPKGWRLPTISSQSGSDIGSTNEYARLNYLYNNNSATSDANLLVSPLYFVRSGDIYNGSVRSIGQEGKYISSTLVDSRRPYVFLFSNSEVLPAYTHPNTSLQRNTGYPVRCVAR